MSMASGELWVFAYGSLMWRPGFRFAERYRAKLSGYRRSLCVFSVLYRGTSQRPGLVLGLDRGGLCEGVAYRIAPEDAHRVLDYIRARELIYGVYQEALLPVTLTCEGRSEEVIALTYIAERRHPSYAGDLGQIKEARIVRSARGTMGPNADYLFNTVAHLRELSIRDQRLERLAVVVGALFGRHPAGDASRPAIAALANVRHSGPRLAPPQNADDRNRFGYRRALYSTDRGKEE